MRAIHRIFEHGADDEARTRYLHLGKVALYQMSYARMLYSYCRKACLFYHFSLESQGNPGRFAPFFRRISLLTTVPEARLPLFGTLAAGSGKNDGA